MRQDRQRTGPNLGQNLRRNIAYRDMPLRQATRPKSYVSIYERFSKGRDGGPCRTRTESGRRVI